MKKTLISTFLAALILTLLGCGGTGGRNLGGGGRYCSDDEDQRLFNTPKKAEVLAEDVSGIEALPKGEYDLHEASYLYVRKADPVNSRRWIMLSVLERKDKNGEPVTLRSCARGLKKTDPSFSSEAPGIKKMTVGDAGKVDYEPSLWGFNYSQEKLFLEPPYCAGGKVSCDSSEKTSFSGKLEPSDFADYKDVLTSFADQVKVIKLPLSKRRSVQRYLIVARADFQQDSKDISQVLRIEYSYKTPEQVAAEKEANGAGEDETAEEESTKPAELPHTKFSGHNQPQ